jgi:PIN domain nuclease of toxin-antitoxin system
MILMDTCALVWDALDPAKLSAAALGAIDTADQHNTLIIADISLWEVAMLVNKGRIQINTTPANFINLYLQSRNIMVHAISPEIAELSVNIGAEINNDPADRIIAATSIIHNARLVTADQNLRNSSLLDTVW